MTNTPIWNYGPAVHGNAGFINLCLTNGYGARAQEAARRRLDTIGALDADTITPARAAAIAGEIVREMTTHTPASQTHLRYTWTDNDNGTRTIYRITEKIADAIYHADGTITPQRTLSSRALPITPADRDWDDAIEYCSELEVANAEAALEY